MAATKTKVTMFASASIAAAGTGTATEENMSTRYGGLLTVKLTNGATAPTVAPNVYVYSGGATTEKKLLYKVSGDIVNSSVNEYSLPIPQSVMFLNVDIKDHTANAITAEAILQRIDAL